MKNNYHSNNSNYKSINSNDNRNNNVTSLIFVKNVFFTSCLNVFKLMFLFIELSNLFQTEGPIYERLFCLMLVFREGTLSLV